MRLYKVLVNGFEIDCDWFTKEYAINHTTKEVRFIEIER